MHVEPQIKIERHVFHAFFLHESSEYKSKSSDFLFYGFVFEFFF